MPTAPNLSAKSRMTYAYLVDTALQLAAKGVLPSFAELQSQTGLSRATIYRHFPGYSDLLAALQTRSLRNLQDWNPTSSDIKRRMKQAVHLLYADLSIYEVLYRRILADSLSQMPTVERHEPATTKVRGNRLIIIDKVIQPLQGQVPDPVLQALKHELALLFGIEAFIVFRDILGLPTEEAEALLVGMALKLIDAVMPRTDAITPHPPLSAGT